MPCPEEKPSKKVSSWAFRWAETSFGLGLDGRRTCEGWQEVCDHLEAPQERRARAEAHGNETAEEIEDEGDQKLCVNRAASQKLRSQQRSRLNKKLPSSIPEEKSPTWRSLG